MSTVAERAKAEFVFDGFYLFNMHEIVGGRIHKRNIAQAEKSGIFKLRPRSGMQSLLHKPLSL
jgi:hypothetical protein